MTTETFAFNGYTAVVIRPDNPNGSWIWKTEFLYAFDQAERALCEQGYTRVYYQISDKYGSDSAVRLMRKFHHFVTEKYALEKQAVLFGFSRGGLYAFNFALFYPEYVKKIYLDAPVLDLKTWPNREKPTHRPLVEQMYHEYGLNDDTICTFQASPVDNLAEFFSLKISLLLVAGGSDEVVPFEKNAGKMIAYCKERKISLTYYVKPDGKHHPHSLDDVAPIVSFVMEE